MILSCYLVPGQAHTVLAKDQSPAWTSLYNSYQNLRREIEDLNPDLIVYYSTQWLSCLGYMVQGDATIQGVHVDPNWHEFGSMNYQFKVDTDFARTYEKDLAKLGHTCKLINYKGFPIDTGTIVAQKLLNPENRFASAMLSYNFYANLEDNIKIGKVLSDTLHFQNKKAVAVFVSSLSNRFFTTDIDPREDHISSENDNAWNQKILRLFEEGSVSKLLEIRSEFAVKGNADMGFNGIGWIAGILNSQNFRGKVFDYQPVWGTGNALIGIYPNSVNTKNMSYENTNNHLSTRAPEAVGPYPHARQEGDFLFLSGIGPRTRGSSKIPGAEYDSEGQIVNYDIAVQTHSVFANIKTILEECGCTLKDIIDCQVFLTHMKRDFAEFNKVYREYFDANTGPTRTTIEVGSLPTPIAIEFKVIAKRKDRGRVT